FPFIECPTAGRALPPDERTAMTFAPPEEADAFLAAHPDVQRIELFIIDPCGVPRGKLLHRDELRAIYTDGRPLPSSILGLTIRGEAVDATGVVWDVADADCRAFPLAGSLQVQPWREPATAQVDRKSTRLNSSHVKISYAVFC